MPVELSKLRVAEEVYADLRWYFSCLDSEFGIKSNFDAMVSAIGGTSNQNKTTAIHENETVHARSGRHTYDSSDGFHDAAIGKLASVAKERRILAGLKDLTKKQYSTLEAIYEPRQYGNMLVETFGQLAGLACLSEPAKKAYRTAASIPKTWGLREWLDDQCRIAAVRWQETGDSPELRLVHSIRIGIEADAIDAHLAYASFRRLPPRKTQHA